VNVNHKHNKTNFKLKNNILLYYTLKVNVHIYTSEMIFVLYWGQYSSEPWLTVNYVSYTWPVNIINL